MPGRRPRKVALIPIERFEAQHAANTIAQAREHLANPRMLKAIKAHVDGLSDAISGGLRPKKPRPTVAKKGTPW